MNTTNIIKRTKPFYVICSLLFCLIFVSCYDEQEGNDFDSIMDDVIITIPETAYSGSLGKTITIEPTVRTSIPESDLAYLWEVQGARENEVGREFFAPMVNDEDQGRTLNYVCHLDSNITDLNHSYECRLHIKQKSTGRDFYSASPFTVTIEGITGLMVLYGDGTSTDIGVIMADEFMPQVSSLPEAPTATTGLYSMTNGSTLKGIGHQILQICPSYIEYYGDDAKNNCRISVMTDQESVWLERNDLSLYGDWNALFYLQGERKVNQGIPRGFSFIDQEAYVFDGDDLFVTQPTSTPQYLFPTFTPSSVCNGHTFKFEPIIIKGNDQNMQEFLYANSIDGSDRKGFVAFTQSPSYGTPTDNTILIDTQDDPVPFNPGDMHATLVRMGFDSREHVVAVLKGDGTHPTYGNGYFFIDFTSKYEQAGASTYQNLPQAICGMGGQPDITQAKFFDFGSTQNMYYYCTQQKIYHYALDGTALTTATELAMTNGASLGISGEITMMKMLDSPEVTRHDSDEILLVATYNGSQSALYALHLDIMTGNVERVVKYDSTNVDGWSFGRIYDVNIKSL